MIDKKRIIDFMKSPAFQPMEKTELSKHLSITTSEKKTFRNLLKNLVLDGTLIKIKNNYYTLPDKTGLVVGILRAHENGFGFVIPEDETIEDVFIPQHGMSTAMNNDKVLVRIDQSYSSKKKQETKNLSHSGLIIRIIERNNATIVGTLSKSKKFFFVIPDNPKLFHDVYISPDATMGAKQHDKVVVKITGWPSKHVNPEGEIIERLGSSNDPQIDVLSVIKSYNLPLTFPDKVISESEQIPLTAPPPETIGRIDLRKLTTITIDPDDAKDYDDAVSLETRPDGTTILGVHIADVSYYVKPLSALDCEARQRANSVYLPDRVIPMLPPRLSNNICSLKEKENRLTKSVFIHYSEDGTIQKCEFHNAVICSSKRFTYKEVLNILKKDKELCQENRSLVPLIKSLGSFTRKLHAKRVERGTIELNLPEIKVRLDSHGKAIGIERIESDIAHSLIEECMLAANEAVSRHISNRGLPTIYRVHDFPAVEDLEEFAVLAKEYGHQFNTGHIDSKQFQKILSKVKNKPEEHIINIGLLRSLRVAEYSPKNIGHFALAIQFYSHFTSPIRRYPDLIVHRILDRLITKSDQYCYDPQELKIISKHCSTTERTAADAEQEVVTLKKLQFLQSIYQKKQNTKLSGVITSIKNHGFFVELTEYITSGFVRVSSLKDDYYTVDLKKQEFVGRRRKRKFKLGQKITVRIEQIDLYKKQIDFVPV